MVSSGDMKYRLTDKQKESISKNLINFMKSDNISLSGDAVTFIGNWILSGAEDKTKAYYDVWDIVLRNYMPLRRPMLYRSCNRRTNDKITSFTGRFESACRFSNGKGILLLCDTAEIPVITEQAGHYRNTFFPVGELLKKESKSSSCKFSDRLIRDYVGENEYIMRVNLGFMYSCKWCKDIDY